MEESEPKVEPEEQPTRFNPHSMRLGQKVYNVLIDQTCPIPCLRFIRQIGQMNLEASRFGKHAVQHIQIPEAE
ncbi:hypothetical protein DAPPUDRAFT_248357 [Daphnia pulex]|uniref:Uncharacterized protein n=1 Tax=Daphnia pulex TaxID=6669 RepID=E9GU86_DAPPU|nr:hypothetical protein DAPPUDRAFT_248357 [Daphnia pulex]|eukprot:EFX77017.1 hypothetical protein DAPPUDRAFT_248357 [Daphnia pulex]